MTGLRRGFWLRLLAAGAAAAAAWWLLRPEVPGPTPRATRPGEAPAGPALPPPVPKAATSPPLPPGSAPSPGGGGTPPGAPGAPPAEPPSARVGEGAGGPDLVTIRGFLAQALEEHFSRHKLSQQELDELASSVLSLREARRRLAALERRPEHAAELARAREEVARATARFEEILDMSPAEFTERLARAGGVGAGLSDPEDREPVPAGEFLEDLPPAEAP